MSGNSFETNSKVESITMNSVGDKHLKDNKTDTAPKAAKEEFCTYASDTSLHGIGHVVAGHTSFIRRFVIYLYFFRMFSNYDPSGIDVEEL